MKTKVRWMGEGQFIVDNNRHLNLAVTDSKSIADSGEPTCLDLILMGFAGCIYSEFRKTAEARMIPYDKSNTELILEFSGEQGKPFSMKVDLETRSRVKSSLLRECLQQAIKTSMPGLLLTNTGIPFMTDVLVKTTSEVMYY